MLSSLRFPIKSLVSAVKAGYATKPRPMQKIIMMCGAPGVGKGTYSRLLAEDFGYVKISTGDEIRKILDAKPNQKPSNVPASTTSMLKRYVSTGKLVPDELIMEILFHKIKEPSSARGVILDGFPRTIHQFNLFSQMLPIHLAISITQSHEYLMASLLGRRTCVDCGMSYSAKSFYKDGYELDVMMPAKKGICDHCGGQVKIREDDKKEIIHERLKEYETNTFPVLKNIEHSGIPVIPFEAKRGYRDYPKLQQIVVSQVGLPCYYHFYEPEYNKAVYYN